MDFVTAAGVDIARKRAEIPPVDARHGGYRRRTSQDFSAGVHPNRMFERLDATIVRGQLVQSCAP